MIIVNGVNDTQPVTKIGTAWLLVSKQERILLESTTVNDHFYFVCGGKLQPYAQFEGGGEASISN
jgi:hypothetical protein